MKGRRKKNKYILLLIVLLGVGIGFAALSTTLKINGTTNISGNIWDVYWDSDSIDITPNSKGSSNPIVSNDTENNSTILNWTVNLDLPGDFYEFTIDAVNNGTLDAMIMSINDDIPDDIVNYVNCTITYNDDYIPEKYDLLAKKVNNSPTRKTYKIRVEFLNTITLEQLNEIPENGLDYEFFYEIDYGLADERARVGVLGYTLPQGRTKHNLELGDELCLNDECFNFIRYDSDKVIMLAKYNLKVGYIYNSSWNKIGEYVSSDPNYGMQDSSMIGWINNASSYKGTLAFSNTGYWDNNSTYPLEVYNSSSILYDYINAYKETLEGWGARIDDARLLTYSEVTNSTFGCVSGSITCATTGNAGFITNTSYWIGTASNANNIWHVNSNGYFNDCESFYEDSFGIRPVLVVYKKYL